MTKYLSAKPLLTEAPHLVYQIKVELLHVPYAVWRVLLIDGETDMYSLQIILLRAMDGWDFSHLFGLEIPRRAYRPADERFSLDEDQPENRRLCDTMKLKAKAFLTYDYGDSWKHEVTVMKILPDSTAKTPFCIRAAGKCPPEDCGGSFGLAYKLGILQHPEDPEYEEIHGWMGDFNPEEVSLESINRRIG
ncbi:MAG: plasmid pRiA4b ORF-3 family protein [Desulfovibrionaceae bacterium]|nr:plasmid pRiA4b ORF-3 family protein [Desulfovibrionaceae bacterium]